MSQFQGPPPNSFDPADPYAAASQPQGWSAAAISGFVLSFLGCTGIGAILGLLLGIVGIVRTFGGRRRGLGLAVAAIPISLVTGLIGAILGVTGLAFWRSWQTVEQLPAALGTELSTPAARADKLLELVSDDLRAQVTNDSVESWLQSVKEKHGPFVTFDREAVPMSGWTMDGRPYVSLTGKFVTGAASVKIVFDAQTVLSRARIDDLDVDGMALREYP